MQPILLRTLNLLLSRSPFLSGQGGDQPGGDAGFDLQSVTANGFRQRTEGLKALTIWYQMARILRNDFRFVSAQSLTKVVDEEPAWRFFLGWISSKHMTVVLPGTLASGTALGRTKWWGNFRGNFKSKSWLKLTSVVPTVLSGTVLSGPPPPRKLGRTLNQGAG